MKIGNEFKIGLLGVFTLAILIVGYKYLKGSNLFDQSNIYYTRFKEVDQLDASAPVLVRGLKVGSVTKVTIDPDDPNLVLVALEIKNEIKLPADSKAFLLSKIVGGKSIEIRFSEHCKDNCLKSGDTIEGFIAGAIGSIIGKEEFQDYLQVFGGELNTILDTLTDPNGKTQISIIIKDLSVTLHSLAAVSQKLDVLLKNSSKNLEQTFSNLNQLSNTLSKNSNAFGQSLQNLEKITGSLEKSDPGKMVTNANQTINEGKKTLHELGNTVNALNKVIDKIDAGQGTMGKLVNDPALYKNLERTSKNLDLFLQDIRLNPKRYIHVSVFGSKSKEYENPTSDPAEIKEK